MTEELSDMFMYSDSMWQTVGLMAVIIMMFVGIVIVSLVLSWLFYGRKHD